MPGENIYSWSPTAASNSNADSLINWAEGQARASVNDSSRSMMAAHAHARDLQNGSIVTGGTANAQTVASGYFPAFTAIPTGMRILVKNGFTNTASLTLNFDGIGAVPVHTPLGGELAGGEIAINMFSEYIYDGTSWVLLSTSPVANTLQNGSITTQPGSGTDPNNQTATTGLTALIIGMRLLLKMGATNTGPATLNLDGLGAKPIVTQDGKPLVGGELVTGAYADLVYDGTSFILLTSQPAGPSASILLAKKVAPAFSSTLDFTTGIDATYDEYLFNFIGVGYSVGGTVMCLITSGDNGATWDGTGPYARAFSRTDSNNVFSVSGTVSDPFMILCGPQSASNQAHQMGGELRLFNPSKVGVVHKPMTWHMGYYTDSGLWETVQGSGANFGAGVGTPINGVRFFPSGGLLFGTIAMYGLRK